MSFRNVGFTSFAHMTQSRRIGKPPEKLGNQLAPSGETPRNGARLSTRSLKTKAPQTHLSRAALVEQPSPEVCSQPSYVLTCTMGMARMGYCGKRKKPSAAESRTTVRHFLPNLEEV